MNLNIKKIAVILLSLILSELVLYVYYIYNTSSDIYSLILFSIILVTLIFIENLCFIIFISIKMNKIINGLDTTIQSLINEETCEVFSTLEDDLLSKLQCKVLRIAKLLKSRTYKLNEEKEKITMFIADISHQLKTPLTNLNIYTTLVTDENITEEEHKKFMRYIKSQVEKLNWLMESFIKMSRLDAEIIQLNKINRSITETILKAIYSVSLKATNKNIDITFSQDEDILIKHDTKWTEEVIFNILDNAVKYSKENTKIQVSIGKYELFCHIDIRDEGTGISNTEVNKIFQRFYRGKNSKDIEGVGIGLFIARKIISSQGGYIKVNSKVNKGTTFSVFLPL